MSEPNPDLDHTYFSNIDTEEKAYWLGFILGDGCVCINEPKWSYRIHIGLNTKDDAHLVKFAKAINWKNKKRYNQKNNTVNMVISSKQMCNDLVKLGITPRKSLTAKFPKVKKKLEVHLLRGLFDADGSIINHSYWKGNPYAKFQIVGSMDCMKATKRILNLDQRVTRDHNIWRTGKNGTPAVKLIYEALYKGATVWLDRKKEKFETFYPNTSK